MDVSDEIKSVIIGLYRQGNNYSVISMLTDVSVYEVDKIISSYLLKKNLNNYPPIYLN